ncbi:MAG: EAL domain-containing protein [Oscillospiraceae bacterium]
MNTAYDYAALTLLIVLLVSTIIRKMTKGNTNRVFLAILIMMLLATCFDIGAIRLNQLESTNYALRYLMHTGYLLFHSLTPLAYVIYTISLADTWHKVITNVFQQLLIMAPAAAIVVLLAANLFTDCMFGFEQYQYVRGELFWTLYAVAIYHMALGMVLLFINRKLIPRSKIIAIGSIAPFLMAAALVQFFRLGLSIEMFANSLSLLLISATAQRPEELLDPITGIGNYSAYSEYTKRSFVTEKHISIIMLHITNFTRLQSMVSYDITSEVLHKVTAELVAADRLYRSGGELYYLDRGRFRIILHGRNIKKADEIARYLDEKMNELSRGVALPLSLSLSICVVDCPEDIKDFKTLNVFGSSFHEREYNSGGGVLYASELFKNNRFEILNNIDSIIDNALREHSFRVYYQPIFNVEKNRFSTAEALLRLIDDKYGFVPPDVFIPAAEKSGAIHKIGDFVLEEVCRFIASDRFAELGLDYIEINLSVAQCMHSDLADKVLETLEKYKLSPDKINLEITETAAATAHDEMRSNLEKLSGAGISFSLDDYGTGYSNMRRVIQLPLKIVKLDKSFVDEQNNPRMWIVLQNTIKMLKDMNMEIVVEGIETEKMVQQFSALSCDYIQGYYYSKPIPEEEFVSFLKKARSNEQTMVTAGDGNA